jgi:hypothetical protein
MSLTYNQKSHLKGLLAVLVILGVAGGIGYFIFWACETTSVQHFCSGSTGFYVNNTNGNGQSTAIKYDDPSWR